MVKWRDYYINFLMEIIIILMKWNIHIETRPAPFCDKLLHWVAAFTLMTISNRNIYHVTGPLCWGFTGEFPAQRPVFGALMFSLICALSKQSSGW